MTGAVTGETPRPSMAIWAFAPVLVLGPALTCGVPRIMAPLFLISMVLAIAIDAWERRRRPDFDMGLLRVFGAFILLGVASRLWTINPDETLGKAGQLAAAFGCTVLAAPIVMRMTVADLKRMGWMIAAGLFAGIAMYINEMRTNFWFYDALRGGVSDGSVIDTKQNKAVVLCAIWMFALFPFMVFRADRRLRAVFAALVLGTLYITTTTHSASAQGVMGASVIVILGLWVLPSRWGTVLTLAVSAAMVASMPLLTWHAYHSTNWVESGLPDSVKSRVEIWEQATRRMMEKPALGWGLDSAEVLPNRGEQSYLAIGRDKPVDIKHLHPHNGPLQIWFELGVVGIGVLLALFALVYQRLQEAATDMARRYGTFMWGTIFLYTLSIWGIWQSWFVATLCFTGLLAVAGMRRIALTASEPR